MTQALGWEFFADSMREVLLIRGARFHGHLGRPQLSGSEAIQSFAPVLAKDELMRRQPIPERSRGQSFALAPCTRFPEIYPFCTKPFSRRQALIHPAPSRAFACQIKALQRPCLNLKAGLGEFSGTASSSSAAAC